MKKQLLTFWMVLSTIIGNAQTILFQDPFEALGGALDYANWDTSNIGNNALIDVAAISSINNGQYGVRLGKTNDAGGLTTNHLDLPLDLTGKTHVNLEFYILSFQDDNDSTDGIYFSTDNGANFTKVFDLIPESWCAGWGQFPPIKIERLAEKYGISNWATNQFVLRFQHSGVGDFNLTGTDDGFYLDEIKVYVPLVTYAVPSFADEFLNPTLGPEWSWEFGDSTTIGIAPRNITRINQIVATDPVGYANSAYKVRLGKSCDQTGVGSETTSALDLHLNLLGLTKVDLSFKIQSYQDDNHINDGIYLSDDGGKTFSQRAFAFIPASWGCGGWGEFPPLHLDQLAAAVGKQLTDSFVVRFQQFDNADFNLSGDDDGYYLDNISVYVPQITYSTIPYSETFLTDTLNNEWSWEAGDSTSQNYNNVTRINSIVDISTDADHSTPYGVRLGRACDETNENTASIIDLHLQLANTTQDSLTFWLNDIGTEPLAPNGIFFSDNAGISFTQVYVFNTLSIPNTWTYFSLSIDDLISTAGLQKTNSFIIRFQYLGDADFNLSGDEDGFYLDDINISGTVGISEINSSSSFYVTPNPAKNNITIVMPQTPTLYSTITILNSIGSQVYTAIIKENRTLIDVSKFATGIYSIQVANENAISTKRFIKQ